MLTLESPPKIDTDSNATTRPADPLAPPALSPQRALRRGTLVKHLTEIIIVAETAALLERQTADIRSAFGPRNAWQDWLAGTIATIILRINRSERIERKLRDLASYRAIDFWEDDRRLAVETVALKIGKEPARTVAQLRETPAGIDWLLTRWRILAQVEPASWGDDLRALAGRLVGADPAIDPTRDGFARERIEALEAHRARVVEADAIVRGLVEADLSDELVPDLAKLRRYVRSLHRQLKWYVDQFHVEHPDRWDDPRRRPASDGPVVEEYRPLNKDQFEGKPEPIIPRPHPAETAAPTQGGTNRTAAALAPEKCRTKPSEAIAVSAGVAPGIASGKDQASVVVHDYSNETGRHHGRALAAGERSREYARRRRAARRRTNLDLAALL